MTAFWAQKMVPKILQANPIFYVVFATGKQTVLAEKLKVFKKARRDASSPVSTKPPGEEECYFSWKISGRHRTELAKHLYSHGAIVTCFRRVMIVFAAFSREKSKSKRVSRVKRSFIVFFLAHEARCDFRVFSQMPAKSIVTRLKHVTNARCAARKCQISLHTSLELWKQYFPRKMLLGAGLDLKKMPPFWWAPRLTNWK